ncbi:MAG TPA: cytochrome c [Candidatus Angelobacter sp.]|nr:cytochrome c [Candidatus Angelobacter sp.]
MKLIRAMTAFAGVLAVCGCKAGTPGKAESSMANEVKHAVTIGGKDTKNPIAYSADAAKEGGEHFQHHCQICHGLDGQNTGVPFATKMDPPVADLSTKDVQDYTDGQLKWIIENGIGPSGMPGWKGILEDEEMWNIVHYIRHLPAKGSLGDPQIYKEEAEEHEHAHGAAHDHHDATPHPHKH